MTEKHLVLPLPQRWDIFCSVVDNFGDIGICWRLSQQLSNKYGINVRLWVDDLDSFRRICPDVQPSVFEQCINDVTVIHWRADTFWHEYGVASVVIETLACNLPLPYQTLMAEESIAPIWINFEYLSAEEWIEDCHGLPSPQPQSQLQKYFFFPGFTTATGGLIRETDLLEKVDEFQRDIVEQEQFWKSINITNWQDFSLKICLFGYDHQNIQSLLSTWAEANEQTLCVIPEGKLAEHVSRIFEENYAIERQHNCFQRGNLVVRVLPFLAQSIFDNLLWSCDVNFVRGEDSFVRAQWAGKPFVWQIYKQEENAHLVKLTAFLERYCENLPVDQNAALQNLWSDWNRDKNLAQSWKKFRANYLQIKEHSAFWRSGLAVQNDVAANLVRFVINTLTK